MGTTVYRARRGGPVRRLARALAMYSSVLLLALVLLSYPLATAVQPSPVVVSGDRFALVVAPAGYEWVKFAQAPTEIASFTAALRSARNVLPPRWWLPAQSRDSLNTSVTHVPYWVPGAVLLGLILLLRRKRRSTAQDAGRTEPLTGKSKARPETT